MPARLSHYEIRERVGAGAMGAVFRAWDQRMHREVALKVLHASLAMGARGQARFRREAWAEAALNHPNVAICYDIGRAPLEDAEMVRDLGYPEGTEPEVDFLCMEFVGGQDLWSRIRGQPLDHREVLRIGIQIATGLQAAHDAGIVHRDLKPGNIRLTEEGQVKILDFGLAQFLEVDDESERAEATTLPTQSRRPAGTPGYMSPEQASGIAVDARSDLFSLGVLLYELVTGRRPYEGSSIVEVQQAIWHGPPAPMTRYASNVPEELERLVRKLLSPAADDRYQTARGVLADLERLAGKSSWPSGETMEVEPPSSQPHLLRWFLITLLLGSLVLGGVQIGRGCGAADPRNLTVQAFHVAGDGVEPGVAQAISSSLVTELSQIEGLSVITLGVAASYEPSTVQELARAVGAQHVVEGQMRRAESSLQLDVHLVAGERGRILWSERYSVDAQSPLGVCPRIVTDLCQALSVELTERDRERLALAPSRPLEAYELYAKGRRELERVSEAGYAGRAIDLFEESLAKDEELTLARAGLASALLEKFRETRAPELLERARQEAETAVRADPELLDARIALARVFARTGGLDAAVTELEGVLRANPDRDDALFWLALLLQEEGRFDEAQAAMRRALDIRPEFWRHWNRLGDIHMTMGDYDAARLAFERAVEHAPAGVAWPYENLAALELRLGNYQRAEPIFERIPRELFVADTYVNQGYMYYAQERFEEAARSWEGAAKLDPNDYMVRINLGDLYYLGGDSDAAAGRYREAIRLLDIEIQINSADASLRLWRNLCLSKSGGCDEAIEDLEQRMDPPADGQAALIHAVVYGACKDREKTLDALERALELECPRDMIRQEPAFGWLHDDAEFRQLSGIGATLPSEDTEGARL